MKEASAAWITKIGACQESCSYERDAIKSMGGWDKEGISYIIDFNTRTLHKYIVYIDYIQEGQARYPVQKTLKQTLTATDKQALPELLKVYDDIEDIMLNIGAYNTSVANEPYFSDLDNEEPNLSNLKNTSLFFKGDIHAPQDVNLGTYRYSGANVKNAYDFMQSSQERNRLYNLMFRNYDIALAASLNRVTNMINVGEIGLKDLDFKFTIKFDDNSHVDIAPNNDTDTFDIMRGTGVDKNETSIPQSALEAVGKYKFSYLDAGAMSGWLGQWGGDFKVSVCKETIVLVCSFSKNTLTCTVITPECQY